MENDKNKPAEKKLKTTNANKEANKGREQIEPLKEGEVKEKAKEDNYTDVVESGLGIDE